MTKLEFGSVLRRIDVFGKKVQLTHEANETYRTAPGGLITIVMGISVLSYMFYMLADVWSHTIISISTQTLYRSAVDQTSILNINSHDFDFGVGFTIPLTEDVGTLEAFHITRYRDGTKD